MIIIRWESGMVTGAPEYTTSQSQPSLSRGSGRVPTLETGTLDMLIHACNSESDVKRALVTFDRLSIITDAAITTMTGRLEWAGYDIGMVIARNGATPGMFSATDIHIDSAYSPTGVALDYHVPSNAWLMITLRDRRMTLSLAYYTTGTTITQRTLCERYGPSESRGVAVPQLDLCAHVGVERGWHHTNFVDTGLSPLIYNEGGLMQTLLTHGASLASAFATARIIPSVEGDAVQDVTLTAPYFAALAAGLQGRAVRDNPYYLSNRRLTIWPVLRPGVNDMTATLSTAWGSVELDRTAYWEPILTIVKYTPGSTEGQMLVYVGGDCVAVWPCTVGVEYAVGNTQGAAAMSRFARAAAGGITAVSGGLARERTAAAAAVTTQAAESRAAERHEWAAQRERDRRARFEATRRQEARV